MAYFQKFHMLTNILFHRYTKYEQKQLASVCLHPTQWKHAVPLRLLFYKFWSRYIVVRTSKVYGFGAKIFKPTPRTRIIIPYKIFIAGLIIIIIRNRVFHLYQSKIIAIDSQLGLLDK